jgi:hypothetical protein
LEEEMGREEWASEMALVQTGRRGEKRKVNRID